MKKRNVLIIGAGVAGTDVATEIKRNPDMGLQVVGFIDDDPNKSGEIIESVPVVGTKKNLVAIIGKLGIEEVIIAIPSAEGETINDYVKACSDLRVRFSIVPRVREIIEGRAKIESVRKVRVEDILGRPVIKSDVTDLQGFLRNKKVLITGAAGSIGSELSRQVAAYQPANLVLFDWWENGIFELKNELTKSFPKANLNFVVGNIQDKPTIKNVIKKIKPDFIFHAAAYKHVPLMEEFPVEAVKNNILGTLNLAEEAKAANVSKFVLISTDKAAEPVNIMGATKLVTEGIGKMFNSGKTKFMAVRFGNVLGSYGSVVPIFMRQIEEGGPVTITDKRMTRFFMTIPEAAQLILKAANIGQGGELFVLDMGRPVKIVELAESVIRLSGFVPYKDIKIEFIGVRKGEKITEKTLTNSEKLGSTKDGKIFVSESLALDIDKLPNLLGHLKDLVNIGKADKIRSELQKMIPTLPGVRKKTG
jgi:FlaA1/EpsC-like NDP-sugar epimerase